MTGRRIPRDLRHYVSVLPRNSRAGDGVEIATRVQAEHDSGLVDATVRHLHQSGILYVFSGHLTSEAALLWVTELVDELGSVIEVYPAAEGARRCTIDPALIATS